jgi:hypothetical protein
MCLSSRVLLLCFFVIVDNMAGGRRLCVFAAFVLVAFLCVLFVNAIWRKTVVCIVEFFVCVCSCCFFSLCVLVIVMHNMVDVLVVVCEALYFLLVCVCALAGFVCTCPSFSLMPFCALCVHLLFFVRSCPSLYVLWDCGVVSCSRLPALCLYDCRAHDR